MKFLVVNKGIVNYFFVIKPGASFEDFDTI